MHINHTQILQKLVGVLERMLTYFKSKMTKLDWVFHYFLTPAHEIMGPSPKSVITFIEIWKFHVRKESA